MRAQTPKITIKKMVISLFVVKTLNLQEHSIKIKAHLILLTFVKGILKMIVPTL